MIWRSNGFLVLVIGLLFAHQAVGQDAGQEATQPDSGLAVIDMAEVFKQYDAFLDQQKEMRLDVAKFDKQFRQQKDEIEVLAKQLAQLAPRTQPFENLERQVNELRATLQVDVTLRRKRILEREGRLYAKTYSEVQAEVAQVARKRTIRLVVRYDSAPIDQENRDSILKGMNRFVVFQDKIDITEEVIERLNRRAKAGNKQSRR